MRHLSGAVRDMRNLLKTLMRDEEGITTLEYALVLALIAVASILAWQTFGKTINDSGIRSTESVNHAH